MIADQSSNRIGDAVVAALVEATETVEDGDEQGDQDTANDDHQQEEEGGVGALPHRLVVPALLLDDDLVENGGKGGGVLTDFAAVRLSDLFHAVAGGQTGAAALLAVVILDDGLHVVEGKGQRVADVHGGLVLGGAGHLVGKSVKR